MPELKRKADDITAMVSVPKKIKDNNAISLQTSNASVTKHAGIPRTSNMEAPIMLLTGHGGEIYAAKFHPEGNILASAGFDRQIFLWNVYGECENYHVINGHSGAIVDLHFSPDGSYIYTASTDKSVGIFDTETGQRIKRLKGLTGHSSYVNSCDPSRRGSPMIVSGSDDCSIKVWDQRRRNPVTSLNNIYQVTAVTFSDTADQVISGGIDNDVKIWDLRQNTVLHTLIGHIDTITGTCLSPDGSYVLTNAMDNTLRIWDVRPYAGKERCVKIFSGHSHNFEKNLLHCAWSPDGAYVTCGSSDRHVYIWETTSRRIAYKLPGHLGSVNDVAFHNKEPIILSASSDKQIYLGEFDL